MGNDSRPEDGHRCLRFPFYYEQYEPQRGGEDCQGCGEGHGFKASGDYLRLLRRSQNAGGTCLPDADGEDLRRLETPQRRGTFIYQRPDGSHHGRRDGQLRQDEIL